MLFIARISVRKGVEQIVALSHRLDDLAGQVELHVIGGPTQWSDYRRHLSDLNPRVARYLGGLPHAEVLAALDAADVLVLPSLYEPGGIVVGEALSRGVPVTVSDEVGSAEPIDSRCCRRFPAGDLDALERELRQMLADVRNNPQPLRDAARVAATQHFDPTVVAAHFAAILTQSATGGEPT